MGGYIGVLGTRISTLCTQLYARLLDHFIPIFLASSETAMPQENVKKRYPEDLVPRF
jgi:hypothetical protein